MIPPLAAYVAAACLIAAGWRADAGGRTDCGAAGSAPGHRTSVAAIRRRSPLHKARIYLMVFPQ